MVYAPRNYAPHLNTRSCLSSASEGRITTKGLDKGFKSGWHQMRQGGRFMLVRSNAAENSRCK